MDIERSTHFWQQDRQARAANAAFYDDPAEVHTYLERPNHVARLELVVRTIQRRILETEGARSDSFAAELGASGGHLTERLRHLAVRVIACDISLRAVSLSSRPHHPAVRCDACSVLPFGNARLSLLIACELIEHLFDPISFLHECWRVLRPGGLLILTTPNLATIEDRLRFLRGRNPRQIDPLHPYRFLHIRPFTPELMKRSLEHCRFERIAIASQCVEVSLGPIRLRSSILSRLLPGWGRSLVVSAEKPRVKGLSQSVEPNNHSKEEGH
jgi:SAM-dependent methyltransferase